MHTKNKTNMDQTRSSNMPAHFSVSLPDGDFLPEDTREDGSNPLSLSSFESGRPPDNFALQVFWQNEEDPWSLVNTASSSQANRHNQALTPYYPTNYNFLDYRSGNLPSESGTLPADSGYGSHRPQFSIASNSSVHEDEGPLDPHITEGFLHLCRDVSAFPAPLPGQSELRYQCSECKSWVRTKSELNKHTQRHLKPYHCPVSNCSRREGFSTKNDLARHKKTVHKEHDGNGPIYVCRDGACADKHKVWPRADNFRQHLARVHRKDVKADDDLSPYIQQSSPLREDLKGVGSSVGPLDYNSHPQHIQEQGDLFPNLNLNRAKTPLPHQGLQSVPELLADLHWPPDRSRVPQQHSFKESISSIAPPSALTQRIALEQGEGIITTADKPEDQHAGPSRDTAQPEDPQDCLDNFPVADTSVDQEAPEEMDLSQSLDLTHEDIDAQRRERLTPSSMKVGKPTAETQHGAVAASPGPPPALANHRDELLKYLASVPKEVLESALKDREYTENRNEPADDKRDSKPQNQCLECRKLFNRPCELKKHMKRHEKPYGCTFRDCQKEFGSKNDWKRHESSQHLQLETWNCDKNGCKKICHRREAFKSHLQKDHGLENPKLLEEKLERCRVGRHCDPGFWCGFCVEVVKIQEPGVNAWTKRCDHIDNHLMGKEGLEKKRSSEWEYPEDQQTQESPTLPDQDIDPATTSASSPAKSANRRRKASPDRNPQTSKRSKITVTYMWQCHHCDACFNNHNTTRTCIDCNHQWCSECQTQSITVGEDAEEHLTQASSPDDSSGGSSIAS